MSDPYVIDAVDWHVNRPGGLESPIDVKVRFFTLLKFLQENNLLVGDMALKKIDVPEQIEDVFCISSRDLNALGHKVFVNAYDRWLAGLDKKRPLQDTKVLEKSLARLIARAKEDT
jgi:hypothetical protein